MQLNNLKKLLVATTVFTIATCLVPNSAQAGLGKPSGSSAHIPVFNFDIDTNSPEQPPGLGNDSLGFFPEAIKNFTTTGFLENLSFCGSDPCSFADLTITKLVTDSDGNVSNLKIGSDGRKVSLGELQNIFDIPILDNPNPASINFSQDVLRYDVTFIGTNPEPELVWFIQSNRSNLINDLSGFTSFKTVEGIFPRIFRYLMMETLTMMADLPLASKSLNLR